VDAPREYWLRSIPLQPMRKPGLPNRADGFASFEAAAPGEESVIRLCSGPDDQHQPAEPPDPDHCVITTPSSGAQLAHTAVPRPKVAAELLGINTLRGRPRPTT
jgi:hypothetical protein